MGTEDKTFVCFVSAFLSEFSQLLGRSVFSSLSPEAIRADHQIKLSGTHS